MKERRIARGTKRVSELSPENQEKIECLYRSGRSIHFLTSCAIPGIVLDKYDLSFYLKSKKLLRPIGSPGGVTSHSKIQDSTDDYDGKGLKHAIDKVRWKVESKLQRK